MWCDWICQKSCVRDYVHLKRQRRRPAAMLWHVFLISTNNEYIVHNDVRIFYSSRTKLTAVKCNFSRVVFILSLLLLITSTTVVANMHRHTAQYTRTFTHRDLGNTLKIIIKIIMLIYVWPVRCGFTSHTSFEGISLKNVFFFFFSVNWNGCVAHAIAECFDTLMRCSDVDVPRQWRQWFSVLLFITKMYYFLYAMIVIMFMALVITICTLALMKCDFDKKLTINLLNDHNVYRL